MDCYVIESLRLLRTLLNVHDDNLSGETVITADVEEDARAISWALTGQDTAL
jgi:hypothetical protein